MNKKEIIKNNEIVIKECKILNKVIQKYKFIMKNFNEIIKKIMKNIEENSNFNFDKNREKQKEFNLNKEKKIE